MIRQGWLICSFSLLLATTAGQIPSLPADQAPVAESWIRINQMGYLPVGFKTAVFLSKKEKSRVKRFELRDALTQEVVYASKASTPYGGYAAFKGTFRGSGER